MEDGIWGDIRDKVGVTRADKPAIIGLAAVFALVTVAIGFALFNTIPASDYDIKQGTGSDSSAGNETATVSLFVHVSGSVAHPGLYELSDGARVANAIQAAGGFTDDAAQDSCNLARKVEDGEHIIVMSEQQAAASSDMQPAELQGPSSVGLVNINTASAEQLESLPGIGSATAQKIVADRTANGPYKTVDDLLRVSGIGAKKLSAIEALICV